MTTSSQLPERSARYADPDPLLAAVPGLLGFTPERSVVLALFADSRTLVATLRLDLAVDAHGRPETSTRQQLQQLGAIVAGYDDVAGLAAIIVDDRFVPDAAGTAVNAYRRTFRLIERSFGEVGGLSAGFVIGELVHGAPWFTAWHPRPRLGRVRPPAPFFSPVPAAGVLSDPAISAVALQRAVYSGRPVLPRRSDLVAALVPGPHCDSVLCRPRTGPVPPAPPGTRDRNGATLVVERIRQIADQTVGIVELTCDETNELAEALCSVHTRDLLLALAVTELREAAEELWRRLTRGLSGRAGAAAATLLAHLHYMRGEGAFALVAVQRALELDPEYNLARLVDSALAHGMRPESLSEVVDYSFDLAASLGVDLPPRAYRAAG
ncbi:MAG: DUF4192 domain-containing protein [Gordonia sp. (in: high G+C Gram-positive bacteria)]|uniref:DUF4192 domain-containing protein n=1 Tax=Gordonia sp. (in: high G+C Gram-positive bacteria) TaxID=84139 RepID=UPI003BB66582